jgi:hypothetical protein
MEHNTRSIPNLKIFFRKYFQLPKVTIVSHANFDFESKVYYEFN